MVSTGFAVRAIATTGNPDVPFKEIEFTEPTLDDYQVFVKVKACGVCHTDVAFSQMFPECILGHEAVGEVVEFGSKVDHLEKGELVGFAYMKSSCLNCFECHSGNDIMCRKRVLYPEGRNNGFASGAVCDARFVYKIPKGIDAKHAGPLMCAGSTVFAAMYNANLSPTARIGVVGIGGLGHLGLQFAKAWGCYVVAISSTKDKEAEACKFGAHEFWCSEDLTPEFIDRAEKLDMILNTSCTDLEYDNYLDLLKPNGVFRMIGIPPNPAQIKKVLPFISDQKTFSGALLGGRKINTLMLDFAARHNIQAQIEEFPMTIEGIQDACERVRSREIRYRAVLVVPEESHVENAER